MPTFPACNTNCVSCNKADGLCGACTDGKFYDSDTATAAGQCDLGAYNTQGTFTDEQRQRTKDKTENYA